MAPVAGGVTDAEKDRFVFGARFLERLGAPGKPVHGIVGVLKQVGRFFPDKTVGVRVNSLVAAGCFHECVHGNAKVSGRQKGCGTFRVWSARTYPRFQVWGHVSKRKAATCLRTPSRTLIFELQLRPIGFAHAFGETVEDGRSRPAVRKRARVCSARECACDEHSAIRFRSDGDDDGGGCEHRLRGNSDRVRAFLLQRRPLERLVLYTAALLVAIYGSFFLIWLSARSSGGGVDPKRLGSTARIVIAVLSFQTIALFFVHRFVREHELSWSEAFGFKNDFSRALLTGIAAGCAAVPILIGLQYFSAALMNLVGIHPQEQEAVQLLRSSGGWLNRSIMGFTAVIIAPLAEEVLFRGILYPAIRQHGYPRLALWGGAVFFGAIHMNVATFIPLTIFAVALAWLYDRTRNLTTPVMAHLVFNMTNFIMLFALDLEHVPLNK